MALGKLEQKLQSVTIPAANFLFRGIFRAVGRNPANVARNVEYLTLAEITNNLLDRDAANSLIGKRLGQRSPFLVSRFGSVELKVVIRHILRNSRSQLEKAHALLAVQEAPVWTSWEHKKVSTHAGFFSPTPRLTRRFAEEYISAAEEVDLIGSWIPGESILSSSLEQSQITYLDGISPFSAKTPWTKSLAGKKVLVISPFGETIEQQYRLRDQLFSDNNFLPEFELTTLNAVQSIGGESRGYSSWFEALDSMHLQTKQIDFDIAILGCGSYGFPLGARIKQDGKSAIVLGGITQLLFGIKGKRWDGASLYNEHWVRPRPNETPKSYRKADDGAYW